MSSYKTILINSVPRSGSTLLTTLLQAHPDIKTLYQPLFSYQFKKRISLKSTKKDWITFLDELKTTDDEFCTMTSDHHTDNQQQSYLKDLGIKNQSLSQLPHQQPSILALKHVRFHYLIPHILELDTSACAILLIRDPCAVIYSQMHAKKEGLKDWMHGTDRLNDDDQLVWGVDGWESTTSLFYKIVASYPNRVIIIKYEDLIKKPKECLDIIYERFSLPRSDKPKNIANILANTKNTSGFDYSVYRRPSTYLDPSAPNGLHESWQTKLDSNIIKYITNRIDYNSY